jgi:hypothetical protein
LTNEQDIVVLTNHFHSLLASLLLFQEFHAACDVSSVL